MTFSSRHVVRFDPVHFLKEAINDFLESGTSPSKIASAVIKVATGVELLLKDMLERICPALILEKIDDGALQVAKVFNLGKQMRNPKDLDSVDLKTANFNVLLTRASKFIDLTSSRTHLDDLHKMRNSLVHHKGEVDMWEANLLLSKYIFPFLELMGKNDPRFKLRLEPSIWMRIQQIEKSSFDAFTSQLAKKIQYHSTQLSKLSKKAVERLVCSEPERSPQDIIDKTLTCPACGNASLTAFGDVDVDFDEGVPTFAGWVVVMRCRVCQLDLSSSEVEHIYDRYEEFFALPDDANRNAWEQAMQVPDISDYYP
jgi:hypothetical protein